jgi:hypothetical protein
MSLHRNSSIQPTHIKTGIIQALAVVIWLSSSIAFSSTRESGFSITFATVNTESFSSQNDRNIQREMPGRHGALHRCNGKESLPQREAQMAARDLEAC